MNKLLLLFLVLFTGAYSFNHPEVQWKTVETSHFTINYYDKTESAVYAAWKIAEEVYVSLAELYNYKPVEKIALSLAEYDDFSNGFAEWLTGSIMIWTIDSRFDLRSNTTWLRNVITHEMAHIMSLEQKRSHLIAAVSVDLQVGTPNESYRVNELFSRLSDYPQWLAEGVAQFETEQHGYDSFDSRRKMALRCAVLSGKELSFDEMGNFTHDQLGNELVYNQGYSFTKYIAGQVGKDHLRDLFKESSEMRTVFADAFTAKTGFSLRNLYSTWRDSLRTVFKLQAVQSLSPEKVVLQSGFLNMLPRHSPDGKYLACFSSGSDAFGRTDLVLMSPTSRKVMRRVPYAHTALCFSADSNKVYYVTSREPDAHGSYLNDLFSLSLTNGKIRRITRSGRVYDVTSLPGSDNLLCVRFENNAFGLYLCDVSTGSFRCIVPGVTGMPFVNTTVNPDNKNEAVVSRVVNGQSRLYRISVNGDSLTACSPGGAQEESPCWAKDGRVYYSADYDGVFNIYSIKPDGTDLKRHTKTSGGYFSPEISPAKKLCASHYSAAGFAVAETELLDESYEILQVDRTAYENVPVAEGVVTIKSKPYVPMYRRGIWEGSLIGQFQTTDNIIYNKVSDYDTSVLVVGGSVARYKSDALHKRNKVLGFAVAVQKYTFEEPTYYENRSYLRAPSRLPVSSVNSFDAEEAPFSKLGRGLPPGLFGMFGRSGFSTSQSSGGERDESPTQPPLVAFLQPYFGFESSEMAATVGLTGQATLVNLILPSELAFNPYLSWHCAREWQLDITSDLITRPYSGLSCVTLPVELSWSHAGYINEDMRHNYAGIWNVSGGVALESFSALRELSSIDDTLSVTAKGYTAFVSLFYGIPLLRHASLQLQSYSSFRHYGQPILDAQLFARNDAQSGLLIGNSSEYVYSQNSVNLVVPVKRNINSGTRNYISDLYGNVCYTVQGFMNSRFLEKRGPVDTWIHGVPNDLYGMMSIEHFLSFGLSLGRYKSSMFTGAMRLDLTYQLLNPGSRLTFSSGF